MRGSIATAVALMCVATTACLVTDDIEQRQPPSPEQNHVPRFNDIDVNPSEQPWVIKPEVGTDQQNCIVQTSIMVVIDEDVDDEVVAKWFVDGRYQKHDILIQTTTAQRLGPKFLFDARKFPDDAKWPGYHVVKVVISDGFIDRQDNDVDAGDSGSPTTELQAGKGSVSYSWIIDTHSAFQCSSAAGGAQ